MEKRNGTAVLRLTAASWLSLLLFACTSALVAVSLKRIGGDLGLGFGERGMLAPARSLALAACTLASGYLADRVGKRLFLVAGLCVGALALAWIGLSSGFAGLVVGMALLGVGFGPVESLTSPLMADLHPRRVGTYMNVLHGFYPLGVAATSFLAGLALDRGVPWRRPFLLAAVPIVLLAALFAGGGYPASAAQEGRRPVALRHILGSGVFWLLLSAMVLTAGCEGSLVFWTPNFIQADYGTAALTGGTALAAFSLTMAGGRFGFGAALRFAPLSVLLPALAFAGTGLTLGLVLVDDLHVSMILLGAAGLCLACFWPSILTVATERVAAGSATLLALLATGGIFGFGALPQAIGLVAEKWSLRGALALVPAALAVAGLILRIVFRVTRPPGAPLPG
jgi:MFS family permease